MINDTIVKIIEENTNYSVFPEMTYDPKIKKIFPRISVGNLDGEEKIQTGINNNKFYTITPLLISIFIEKDKEFNNMFNEELLINLKEEISSVLLNNWTNENIYDITFVNNDNDIDENEENGMFLTIEIEVTW